MVFEYTVKYNGKRYLPGEDVPMDEPKVEEPKAEPVVNVVLDEPKSEPEKKAKPKQKKSK